MCYCLGHPSNARFDGDCKYNREGPSAESMAKMHGPCSWWGPWLHSGSTFCKLHSCWMLPVLLPMYYVLGLVYIVLKFLLLNPPCFTPLLSNLRFEVDASFPGEGSQERMEFAKVWYSDKPRTPPFTDDWCTGISSRFCYIPDLKVWIERFSLSRWLTLPAMAAPCVFDDDKQQWHLYSSWWAPHCLAGTVVVGENPEMNGWLISGDLQCWVCLKPIYKFLTVRIMETYADQMIAASAGYQRSEDLEVVVRASDNRS